MSTTLSLPALEPVYRAFLTAADRELTGLSGPLQVELWTAQQLGVLAASAPHEEGYRRAVADLVGYLTAAGTPGAALFLRAFAAVGPDWAPAPPELPAALPSWAAELGRVQPGECFLVQDGSLSGDRVGCEFRYVRGGPPHALMVRLEHGRATEAVVIGDVAGMRAQLAKGVEAEECVLLRLNPAVAGERLRSGYQAPVAADLLPTAAFVRRRAALLP